jgi:uracil-DNA glycosylase
MSLIPLIEYLEQELFPVPSTPAFFNPYNDSNPLVDKKNAPQIRRSNLILYLSSYDKVPRILLVGEAPGYRGCRFTGVPFTSEKQLYYNELPFNGTQSSNSTKPYSEGSASVIWNNLSQFFPSFILWNCFPFHPHQSNNVLSNRKPKTKEINEFSPILLKLHELINPKLVLSIGRTAETTLQKLGIDSTYIRHPSYGGSNIFKAQIKSIF